MSDHKHLTDEELWTLESLSVSGTPSEWEVREHEGQVAICHPRGWVMEGEDGYEGDARDARLIVAVLKDGPSLTLLQLHPDEDADPFAPIDLRIAEDLAPNVVHGLYATFDVVDDD